MNRFGHRMRGEGRFTGRLSQRFRLACKKHPLAPGAGLSGSRTDLFKPPPRAGDGQLDLSA